MNKYNLPAIGTKEFNDMCKDGFGGNIQSNREKSIIWWNNISQSNKVKFWFEFRKIYFTPSKGPSGLTGIEIEKIWTKEILNN